MEPLSARRVRESVFPIECEDDVVTVRRAVRDDAGAIGFDRFAIAAITTAASELSRNVWVHAGRGEAVVRVVEHDGRRGLELVFTDEGPGIAHLDRALRGGFSTARSMGLGLSGSKRLVDAFDIQTTLGEGTRILVRKWARPGHRF